MAWMDASMNFRGLDLNLLVALEALLETRSVSQAANRLHLSQPAMSAALARIREYFQDEILVAKGKRMYPTETAEAVLPQLKDCLRRVEGLILSPTTFNPKTAQRSFSIVTS